MSTNTNITAFIKANLQGGYNLSQLEKDVDKEIEARNREGYKVISVVPLTGSEYSNIKHEAYGESFTIAVMIVFERIEYND